MMLAMKIVIYFIKYIVASIYFNIIIIPISKISCLLCRSVYNHLLLMSFKIPERKQKRGLHVRYPLRGKHRDVFDCQSF